MKKWILAAVVVLAGCSGKPVSRSTPGATIPLVAYTPQPDPSVLVGQPEFAQFRASFYPLWMRLKKALEQGAGNPEFEELQRQFAAIQVNLKDPAKQAEAKEFVRDCGLRCMCSTSERVLYTVELTTGSPSKAEQDDAMNHSKALEFATQGEQRWKALEAGQLVPVSGQTELKVGQKVYQPDGGYVGMVKESRVDKGEMQWVVSAPDGTDRAQPLNRWQSLGSLIVNP